MVFDSFPFLNEFDMLHNHLEYYKDMVDATILIESPLTFSGQKKPLFFLNNKSEFKGYNIVWAKYLPKHENDPWLREFGQRNKALDTITWKRGDVLLINDVDEFVNLDTLERVLKGMKEMEEVSTAMCFIMEHYQGSFNYQIPEPWPGTVILPLDRMRYKPSTYRDQRAKLPLIQNGGWHLSYFGGTDQIQYKIKSYSHLEKNSPEINNKDRIEKALQEGTRIV